MTTHEKPMKTDHLADFDWTFQVLDNKWVHVFDPTGKQRCGVKTNSGNPCKGHILRDTGRCNRHHKNTRRGENHQSTKTGEQSKFMRYSLPERMQKLYGNLMSNDDLYDLTENVVLMDVFIQENLNQLDKGGLGKLWIDALSKWQDADTELRASASGKDKDAFQRFVQAFQSMGKVVKSGHADYMARQEILTITDKRRQLIKTKADIEYRGENAITMAQFTLLLRMFEDLFYRVNRIEDEGERKRLYAEGITLIYEGGD